MIVIKSVNTPKPGWSSNATVNLYDQIDNGSTIVPGVKGDRYVCLVPGITASSGSGPSGTGIGIQDGSVIWNYAGPAYIVVCKDDGTVVGGANSDPIPGSYSLFANTAPGIPPTQYTAAQLTPPSSPHLHVTPADLISVDGATPTLAPGVYAQFVIKFP